jgi:glc operon protein GlcG
MTRFALMTTVVGAALVISSAVVAQVAPNPNNPNDTVPDTFTPTPYGETINLETAKKVAAGAAAEAAKRKWDGFCIAVVGPSGDLVYFEKMDNCQYASITIAQHKARTAARYRRPTLAFENLIGKGPFFNYLTTLDDVIASRGGNPLMVGGKIVGAIGVSGGAGSQDDTLSQAGVAVLK